MLVVEKYIDACILGGHESDPSSHLTSTDDGDRTDLPSCVQPDDPREGDGSDGGAAILGTTAGHSEHAV